MEDDSGMREAMVVDNTAAPDAVAAAPTAVAAVPIAPVAAQPTPPVTAIQVLVQFFLREEFGGLSKMEQFR